MINVSVTPVPRRNFPSALLSAALRSKAFVTSIAGAAAYDAGKHYAALLTRTEPREGISAYWDAVAARSLSGVAATLHPLYRFYFSAGENVGEGPLDRREELATLDDVFRHTRSSELTRLHVEPRAGEVVLQGMQCAAFTVHTEISFRITEHEVAEGDSGTGVLLGNRESLFTLTSVFEVLVTKDGGIFQILEMRERGTPED